MQAGHQRLMLELQHDLGQRGDARRRFQMADIRLHRPDRTHARPDPGKGPPEARDLHRIAQGCAGAMRLDITDRRGIYPAPTQRGADQAALRHRVRHGVAVRPPAMVQRARPDHRMDAVAVRQGPRQGLQQDRPHALTRHIAIPALAKAAATAVAGREAGLAQDPVLARMHGQVDAAREGDRAIPRPQRQARHMHRRQTGRARGIHRHAGAMQVEEVGHPVGHIPIGRIGRDQVTAHGFLGTEQLVVAIHDADEDARQALARLRVASEQGLPRQAGVFHRRPGDFQELARLRVQRVGFARGDVEEPRIEHLDPVDEATPFGVAGLGPVTVGVVEPVQRPAIGGDFNDAVPAGREVAPELIEVGRHRIDARDPDDGDGVIVDGRHRSRTERALFSGWLHGFGGVRGGDHTAGHGGTGDIEDLVADGFSRNRHHGGKAPGHHVRVGLDQAGGEVAHGLVFEEQGLRQVAQVLLHPRVHPHDHHGVDTIGLEPLIRFDPGFRQAGDLGEDGLEIGFDLGTEVRRVRNASGCPANGGGRGGNGLGRAAVPDESPQRGCAAMQGHHPGGSGRQRGVQHGHRGHVRHRCHAHPPFQFGGDLGRRGHAAGFPQRPGDRHGAAGALLGGAPGGEPIQEPIAGGIGRLPRRPEGRGG